MSFFCRINGSLGREKSFADPRLDLDEAKDACVPRNQVDLAAILRSPEVRSDNAISQPAQEDVGCRFAPAARSQVRGSRFRIEAREPVQNFHNPAEQPSHRDQELSL